MAQDDQDDRTDAWVEEYRPLVTSIAHRVRASLDLRSDMDDLLAWGFRGLVEARSRYDASRGVQFNTFAYYRIRGAILDGVRAMSHLPRHVHQLRLAAEAADGVSEDAGAALATAQGAGGRDAGTAVRALDDALSRITASYVLSALGQDGEQDEDDPEEAAMRSETAVRLRTALDQLPERERALVQGFYLQGRRFDHVAEELGISKSWASRLHTKALGLLREALSENPPAGATGDDAPR